MGDSKKQHFEAFKILQQICSYFYLGVCLVFGDDGISHTNVVPYAVVLYSVVNLEATSWWIKGEACCTTGSRYKVAGK